MGKLIKTEADEADEGVDSHDKGGSMLRPLDFMEALLPPLMSPPFEGDYPCAPSLQKGSLPAVNLTCLLGRHLWSLTKSSARRRVKTIFGWSFTGQHQVIASWLGPSWNICGAEVS